MTAGLGGLDNPHYGMTVLWGDAPVEIPGDATGDGMVNEADSQILAANWGTGHATRAMGDFNGDTVVGPADASIMAADWGHGTSESIAVPEPSALVLLLGLPLLLLIRRRH